MPPWNLLSGRNRYAPCQFANDLRVTLGSLPPDDRFYGRMQVAQGSAWLVKQPTEDRHEISAGEMSGPADSSSATSNKVKAASMVCPRLSTSRKGSILPRVTGRGRHSDHHAQYLAACGNKLADCARCATATNCDVRRETAQAVGFRFRRRVLRSAVSTTARALTPVTSTIPATLPEVLFSSGQAAIEAQPAYPPCPGRCRRVVLPA